MSLRKSGPEPLRTSRRNQFAVLNQCIGFAQTAFKRARNDFCKSIGMMRHLFFTSVMNAAARSGYPNHRVRRGRPSLIQGVTTPLVAANAVPARANFGNA